LKTGHCPLFGPDERQYQEGGENSKMKGIIHCTLWEVLYGIELRKVIGGHAASIIRVHERCMLRIFVTNKKK
jgi:hypothetical protein